MCAIFQVLGGINHLIWP